LSLKRVTGYGLAVIGEVYDSVVLLVDNVVNGSIWGRHCDTECGDGENQGLNEALYVREGILTVQNRTGQNM
jgi:hypothetical protein